MAGPIILAFHAEKLHDDRVWMRVEGVARRMAREGRKATFFVYPFRAQAAGEDVTDRVRMLAAWGHEIGQHTHFYAGAKINKPDKVDDFSAANIVHCVQRDWEVLRKIGFRPQGFTAGAWFVNEAVWHALVELGFTYDCSAHLPKPAAAAKGGFYHWLHAPQVYTAAQGRLLCLPTTCSLGEWFKWGRKAHVTNAVPYQFIYLHDYDLLSLRTAVLFRLFLRMTKNDNPQSAITLAQQYLL
jgi:peptidoglycan/xylan/chitin deacetylase (PgdA/CDA1 family)